MRIHLRPAQSLRGTVTGTAKIVLGQIAGKGDRLGNAEVQQTNRAIRTDLHVRRFDVAMDHSPFSAIDLDFKRMKSLKLAADFHAVSGGLHWFHAPRGLQHFGHTLAFHVLHGHEITAVQFAAVIDLDKTWVHFVELLLDERAPAFGLEHHLGPGIGRLLDDLQNGMAVIGRVERQVDIGHTPAELADDLISAELLLMQHARPDLTLSAPRPYG